MKKVLIVNALIWAAVIIVASYLYRGSASYNYLLGVLIVGFTLQNGFTYEFLRKTNKTDK